MFGCSGYPCNIHLRTKTKWRFVPVIDERIFVLNEAAKFCLTVCRGLEVFLKLFLMNKITKIERVNTVLFTTIFHVYEIQIVLKICSLFFRHFCFVVVHAKTISHLSVGK